MLYRHNFINLHPNSGKNLILGGMKFRSDYLTQLFPTSTIHRMKNTTIILLALLFSPQILFAAKLPSDMVQIQAGFFPGTIIIILIYIIFVGAHHETPSLNPNHIRWQFFTKKYLGRKNQGKQYNYRIFHPVNCTGWKWLGQVV